MMHKKEFYEFCHFCKSCIRETRAECALIERDPAHFLTSYFDSLQRDVDYRTEMLFKEVVGKRTASTSELPPIVERIQSDRHELAEQIQMIRAHLVEKAE